MGIDEVFVGGAGLMGHGIAQVFAATGRRVVLYEPELARAAAGRDRIAGNLERAVQKGRLEADAGMRRSRGSSRRPTPPTPPAPGSSSRHLRDLDVKRRFWSDLDRRAPDNAIFASNTSSISIDALAEAVAEERRGRFVGMHFFSPVPVMPLVELVRGTATTDETAVLVRPCRPISASRSSSRPTGRVHRQPHADAVPRRGDAGARGGRRQRRGHRHRGEVGLNHPMGPLELADFIGLDVCKGIMDVLHEGLARSGSVRRASS